MIEKCPLHVVQNDSYILEELLKNIIASDSTQVFVTGPEANRLLSNEVDHISAVLGSEWAVLPCVPAPTQADMLTLLEKFSSIIDNSPSQKHLCFGPVSPENLLRCLFKVSMNGFYKAGIYVLGLFYPPIRNLEFFEKAINAPGRAPGTLGLIVSADDRYIAFRESAEFKALIEQGCDVSGKLWSIMEGMQTQVDEREKSLRAPFPPDVQIDMTNYLESERRKHGLLPPPQNIGISFKCKCGINLSIDLKNFNVFAGLNVKCAHCGTVSFIPPEILDHTKYDAVRDGATLRADFHNMIITVRN